MRVSRGHTITERSADLHGVCSSHSAICTALNGRSVHCRPCLLRDVAINKGRLPMILIIIMHHTSCPFFELSVTFYLYRIILTKCTAPPAETIKCPEISRLVQFMKLTKKGRKIIFVEQLIGTPICYSDHR